MPSVFPGMDPFIEMSEWEDFHTRFIVAISDYLVPQLGSDYAIRVEKRIYFEHPGEDGRFSRTDLLIANRSNGNSTPSSATASTDAIIEPIELTMPSQEIEEK